jgi:RNA polymerase sigma-70 factor (ECF subfamily)
MQTEARTDEELAAATSQGDEAALEEIYQRYAGAVAHLARRILRSDALAEEVSQTVFVQFWRNPGRFDAARGSLRSFLLAMTHGRAVDLIRSEQARQRREVDHGAPPVERHDRAEPGALAHLRDLDVTNALRLIPEPERLAIVTAYFGGYTYREAADLLGEAEGTIKSRIRTGLDRLRRLLEDGEGS